MDRYIKYITAGTLPKDRKEASLLKNKATHYVILDGQLYRRSYCYPLLKCLKPSEVAYMLQEIHEDICGNHMGGRALAHKTILQGYFWETIREDAADFVKKCDKCQHHACIQRQPVTPIFQLSVPWPFT